MKRLKKIAVMLLVLLLVAAAAIAVTIKATENAEYGSTAYYVHYMLAVNLHRPIDADGDAWYTQPNGSLTLVSHALGGVIYGEDEEERDSYTNSLEGFTQSYERGLRIFEVDLDYTSDGQLVGVHDWEKQYAPYYGDELPDHGTFMSSPVMGKYTPVDLELLLDLMERYPDIMLMLDTKYGTDEDAISDFQRFVGDVVSVAQERENGDALLDRMIIQLYYPGQYEAVQEVYPFENCLFTLYKLDSYAPYEVLLECLENRIPVVTMPYKYADFASTFTDKGITVLVHTLDTYEKVDTAVYYGAGGIYTNYLSREELAGYQANNCK